MNTRKIFEILLGILVLLFLGWLLWQAFTYVRNLNPSISVGIFGLSGIFIGAIISHYYTKNREINARHFANKRENYMRIMNSIFDALMSEKTGKRISESKLRKEIIEFKKELMIWGGPEVIDAWNRFEVNSANQDLDSKEIIVEMERLLRSIRKDLGHNDRSLKFGSLSGLILIPEDKKIILEED